jgi:hypothetical protein
MMTNIPWSIEKQQSRNPNKPYALQTMSMKVSQSAVTDGCNTGSKKLSVCITIDCWDRIHSNATNAFQNVYGNLMPEHLSWLPPQKKSMKLLATFENSALSPIIYGNCP